MKRSYKDWVNLHNLAILHGSGHLNDWISLNREVSVRTDFSECKNNLHVYYQNWCGSNRLDFEHTSRKQPCFSPSGAFKCESALQVSKDSVIH